MDHSRQHIWHEFLACLDKGHLTVDRLRPLRDTIGPMLLDVLRSLKEHVPRDRWPSDPEVRVSGDRLTYLVDFSLPNTTPFYFTFVVEYNTWYLEHVETIRIPLDLPPTPTSDFPDLPDEVKSFMREELDATRRVRLFNFLSEKHGRRFALRWFSDGESYFLAARAWIPHLPPPQSFILYLCWEQQRLRGGKVLLEKLTQDEAVVRVHPMWFQVYERHTSSSAALLGELPGLVRVHLGRPRACGGLETARLV